MLFDKIFIHIFCINKTIQYINTSIQSQNIFFIIPSIFLLEYTNIKYVYKCTIYEIKYNNNT